MWCGEKWEQFCKLVKLESGKWVLGVWQVVVTLQHFPSLVVFVPLCPFWYIITLFYVPFIWIYISFFGVVTLSLFHNCCIILKFKLSKISNFHSRHQESNLGLRGTFLGEREDDFFKPTIRSLRKRVQDHTGSRKEFLSRGHLLVLGNGEVLNRLSLPLRLLWPSSLWGTPVAVPIFALDSHSQGSVLEGQ